MKKMPNIQLLEYIGINALHTFRLAVGSRDSEMISFGLELYESIEKRISDSNGPEYTYNLAREEVPKSIDGYIIQAALGTGSLSILNYQQEMKNNLKLAEIQVEMESDSNDVFSSFWASHQDEWAEEGVNPNILMSLYFKGTKEEAKTELERLKALANNWPFIPEGLAITDTEAMDVYDRIKIGESKQLTYRDIHKAAIHLSMRGDYHLVDGMISETLRRNSLPVNPYQVAGKPIALPVAQKINAV